jgi:UV excision repair protein RAD23
MNLILGGDPNTGIGGGQGGGMGGGMGGGQHPPGTIRVTQEELDAINRLTALGFPKHRAAEAYFACDKNEELAANFLFESGVEDEDAQL